MERRGGEPWGAAVVVMVEAEVEVEEEGEKRSEEGVDCSSFFLSFFLPISPFVLLPGKQVQVAAHKDESVELLRPEGDACFGGGEKE